MRHGMVTELAWWVLDPWSRLVREAFAKGALVVLNLVVHGCI